MRKNIKFTILVTNMFSGFMGKKKQFADLVRKLFFVVSTKTRFCLREGLSNGSIEEKAEDDDNTVIG